MFALCMGGRIKTFVYCEEANKSFSLVDGSLGWCSEVEAFELKSNL
jgi:hypothetical protein